MEETLVQNFVYEDREKFFLELYKKTFPAVARYISRMDGSLEEAKDVFHDALVLYYEKLRQNETLPAEEKAYVVGIAKHLWSKRFREKNRYTTLDAAEAQKFSPEKEGNTSEEKVLRFLQSAGVKCMELLSAFYYEKLPLNELAAKFGFSGTRSATVQKFKCLEKVRTAVKEKSLQYEDFLD